MLKFLKISSLLLVSLLLSNSIYAQNNSRVVRMAKIQIDSAQLKNYNALLKKGMETTLQKEQGVLAYYAVEEKNKPTHITIIEVYANEAAYQSHIKTAHFLAYKNGVKDMVKALELLDVNPILLKSKL